MKNLSLLFLLTGLWLQAQFVSPGTGITYTLTSLSAAAPTVLVNNGTSYTMTANVTITAGDTLLMDENTTLNINPGIKLTVAGNYMTTATALIITSGDATNFFNGIQFDATAQVEMRNTTLEYGGGIRVSTGNFLMDNCIVRFFRNGLVTSGAMSFSTGSPVIQNSQFIQNERSALSSAANSTVSATISNNYFSGNTTDNSNRPQINMGPSGLDSIRIINNTVIGDPAKIMVGGIAAASLGSIPQRVRIEGNTVTNNRYGITVYGVNAAGYIRNNIITNNNTQNNPDQGGSGIALYGTGDQLYIAHNEIRGNLWGITLPTSGTANLGSDVAGNLNPGQNIFFNNGNNGTTTALFNNTSNPVMAKFNCWRENENSTDAMVEAVIHHQADDPALGPVTYSGHYNCGTLSTAEVPLPKNAVYPNPSRGFFYFEAPERGNIIIADTAGRIIHSSLVHQGKNEIRLQGLPGVYFMLYQFNHRKSSVKLIIQ